MEMRHVKLRFPDGTVVQMDAPEHLFIPRVLERDGLGKYETDSMAAALALVRLRPGPFVDVGSNVGVFSLLVAAIAGRRCLAFEPLPDAADVLVQTAARHRLPIEVSRVALSDRDGTADFFVSARTDSSSGLDRKFRPVKSSFPVTLARLDDVLEGPAPALLKIDTETTEPAVLAGAVRTIDEHRPPLLIEVLKGRTEDKIQAFFADRGYSWYHVTSEAQWAPQAKVEGDATYAHNNWLFAPDPLTVDFWRELTRWRGALERTAR